MYLLEAEIHTGDLPVGAFWEEHPSTDWAVSRGHWLAGQYVHLYGQRPKTLVVAPTRRARTSTRPRARTPRTSRLRGRRRQPLRGHLRGVERLSHPLHPPDRLPRDLQTVSRRLGALQHLPGEWHEAIRAAGRNYDGQAAHKTSRCSEPTWHPSSRWFANVSRSSTPLARPAPLVVSLPEHRPKSSACLVPGGPIPPLCCTSPAGRALKEIR